MATRKWRLGLEGNSYWARTREMVARAWVMAAMLGQ